MSSFSRVQRWIDRGLNPLLHDREFSEHHNPRQAIRPIYGHAHWVGNLDIVNELEGHLGCVNALSWSKSGRLLASGSDDKHLNVHRYQPEDLNQQFSFATTVATGHRANIFSVKFMPHSNDQTVVTCAGDGEVRVFDLEVSGRSTNALLSARVLGARRRSRWISQDNVRYLSDGNTNCRVYRSHADRVKRIVTESSPHLFLTCSEDGEVRQWDLRMPSSAYPRPRGFGAMSEDSSVPPPLISYREYALDLNTISCSPSQPHYIALGGAHLHCFLHDRRMLGRNKLAENGGIGSAQDLNGPDDLMGKATRCVRKFAPHGRQRMRRADNGHITACKISDANPNEIVVSWSGEHIYTFDLSRSPDAAQIANLRSSQVQTKQTKALRQKSERKRKRVDGSTHSLAEQGVSRAGSRARTSSPPRLSGQGDRLAVRVQYGNGQAEDIAVMHEDTGTEEARFQNANNMARRALKLRSALLSVRGPDLSFTSILGLSASVLPEMREIHDSWHYPSDPDQLEVDLQRALRKQRESALRFVQAAGVLSRAAGGTLQCGSADQALAMFETVEALHNEGPDVTPGECFRYDLLRAIFLWLDSGVGALLAGFSKNASRDWRVRKRYPVPDEADSGALEDFLIPYLLGQATLQPIKNVDASPFEVDESQIIFPTEVEAIHSFAAAVQKPFADLSSTIHAPENHEQDRRAALDFWGVTVARGLLWNAFDTLNAECLRRAFDGTCREPKDPQHTAPLQEQLTNRIDSTAEIPSSEVLAEAGRSDELEIADDVEPYTGRRSQRPRSNPSEGEQEVSEEDSDDDNEDQHSANQIDNDSDDHDIESGEDDSDGDFGFAFSRPLRRSTLDRRRLRETVEEDIPCIPHTRVYRGHCNVNTVKDVNFYGLQDDFVVSGSDDGNFFIWDRKTTKLLNILEGDGEVVNVVQPNPYEPVLAVSGIDNTVKIFSSDARARRLARLGRGVSSTATSRSPARELLLNRPTTHHGPAPSSAASTTRDLPGQNPAATSEPEEVDVVPGGLSSRKRMNREQEIVEENEQQRTGNNEEAFLTIHDILRMVMRGHE